MYVAPPAAPGCWALVGSLLRRSVALGSYAPSPCRVFAGRFLWFRGPSSWCFLELFPGVLSSRFRWLLVARGSSWIILGYRLRRVLLPWCSVEGLSVCPIGAVVPLGSSVLRGSWSSRWVHLSHVGPVVFLRPRSERSLSLLLVGLVPDLRAEFPTSGWRCVLRYALVQEAVPPSHRLLLLLRTGFLFSGPGLGRWLLPFPSPMYSFGMWSPFGSIVSFCHS